MPSLTVENYAKAIYQLAQQSDHAAVATGQIAGALGVLPAFRGTGLSQHLLEAVIHCAQISGVEELRLGVRVDQPRLLDLYAAYHFEPAPELEYSHANPDEPAPSVMRRFLKRM